MGRTARNRLRRRRTHSESHKSLNHEPLIINLTRWMSENHWSNSTQLSLHQFTLTGRGLTSSKHLQQHDTLIEIPSQLLITLNTLENSKEITSLHLPGQAIKYQIHDLLAIFLAVEKLKHRKSPWFHYIQSLPNELPAIPWLQSAANNNWDNLPGGELRRKVARHRSTFLNSWARVERSIPQLHRSNCVLTRDLYEWCYVMVNTRAVYINPSIVRGNSSDSNSSLAAALLSDDPSMALCPYLDMFNHSWRAETEAVFEVRSQTYKLRTLHGQKKHEELFISYGPHDNETLLCEYGFFLPGNSWDTIRFSLEEIVQSWSNVTSVQYKYIKELKVGECSLYVGVLGQMSYNLKQVLYVLLRPLDGIGKWNGVTYAETYTDTDLKDMTNTAIKLLRSKQVQFSLEVEQFSSKVSQSDDSVINSYLNYRYSFYQDCINCLEGL